MNLILHPNIEDPDGFYQALTDAQRDLSEAEANDMNARLVLILANQVGSLADLKQAIDMASPAAIQASVQAAKAPKTSGIAG